MKQNLYTEDELQRVVQLVVQQLTHAPPNLDSPIIKKDVCSSEGEGDMSSSFRETYSYIDEHGNVQSIRFSGTNKRETDAKFQEFLCRPKTKKDVPTLKTYVETCSKNK